ncbi:hypothetical protein [Photorhabdus luminescens]|uniref:Uncharacterized protein n=1 Tax=Photorhabdus luminescens subsp. sonorensis TaxID=1173677 RepID=A0A5C4RD83_PHOLU|nr:hypothetical protein [Photorhabdus luminescens]TNH41704.1 hypothetical protein EP164_21105 [Photorhabdus luminescens subsp. sonorensis]
MSILSRRDGYRRWCSGHSGRRGGGAEDGNLHMCSLRACYSALSVEVDFDGRVWCSTVTTWLFAVDVL